VFGGHGYVREWGIEQIVRDARVAMIYEGTNEIQAIDLLLRKVLGDGGAAMAALLRELCGTLDASRDTDAQVLRLAGELRQITTALVAEAPPSAELAYWVADDYLPMVALLLLAWAWTQIDAAARTRAAAATTGRWSAPAQAFRRWILPEFEMRLGIIRARLADTAAPGSTAN
jgi:Acyl-CoA dehydrogenase, C-terminal domain